MQRSLKTEADEVVTLQDIRVGVDAASEVARVDAGKCVNLSGVTTYAVEFWVLESHGVGVEGVVGDGVVVDWIALVPVVGDGFVAGCIYEVGVVSCDGIERFEDVPGE